MNNHNNGEPRLDENPFGGIIQRALLHQQMGVPMRRGSDPSVQSTGSLPEHGLSGSDRNVKCNLRNSDGVRKGICQHHHRQCACKDIRHDEPEARL